MINNKSDIERGASSSSYESEIEHQQQHDQREKEEEEEEKEYLSYSSSKSVHNIHGYLILMCSAICHSLSAVSVHYVERTYGLRATTALFLRSLTSALLSFCSLSLSTSTHNAPTSFSKLPRNVLILVVLRGFFGSLSVLCSFSALSVLPVGIALTITYLAPAIATILSHIFLNDIQLTIPLMWTLIMNFIGVSLVLHPSSKDAFSESYYKGIIYAFVSSLCLAVVLTIQRSIGKKSHHVHSVITSALFTFIISISLGGLRNFMLYNKFAIFLASFAGIMGFGSQVCLNIGLKYVPVAVAGVIRSFSVPISFVFGFFLLEEKPLLVSVSGVFLVMISVALIGYLNELKEKEKKNGITEEMQNQESLHSSSIKISDSTSNVTAIPLISSKSTSTKSSN